MSNTLGDIPSNYNQTRSCVNDTKRFNRNISTTVLCTVCLSLQRIGHFVGVVQKLNSYRAFVIQEK